MTFIDYFVLFLEDEIKNGITCEREVLDERQVAILKARYRIKSWLCGLNQTAVKGWGWLVAMFVGWVYLGRGA